MPACKACGAKAPDDAKFCPTCGTYFPAAAAPPVSAPPPSPEFPAPPPAPGAPLPARPLGVTIVALWSLATGPFLLLAGIALIALGPTIAGDAAVQEQLRSAVPGADPSLVSAVAQVVGAGLVMLGLAMPVVGYGLYQRKRWAWSGAMGLTVAWLAFGLLLLPAGLVVLALAGFLLWYFTRPGVKRWLGRGPEQQGLQGYVPPPPS